MAAAVTIRDVAKRARVGVGTVSRVLNDSDAVREATRHKVQAAVEALNYSPSPVARHLPRGKTMAIGVIVPFFTNARWSSVCKGLFLFWSAVTMTWSFLMLKTLKTGMFS